MKRVGWLLLLLGACTGAMRAEAPSTPRPDMPGWSGAAPAPQPDKVYGAEEALRDVVSGQLSYLGTAKWPGIQRMYACVYKNERVFVVNVYCSLTDRQAIRLNVYSPRRGRVSLYAEGKTGISSKRRTEYFQFTAESEPPGPADKVAPLSLTMSMEALRAHEEQRYSAYLPSCFGGQELSGPHYGCLGPLAPLSAEWTARNKPFLDRASDTWYRVVSELRAASSRYGREPDGRDPDD